MQKDLLLLNTSAKLPFGAKAITLSCTKDSYEGTFMQVWVTYSDGYREGAYAFNPGAIEVWPGQNVNKSRPGTVITKIELSPFDEGQLTNEQEVRKVFSNVKVYGDIPHAPTDISQPIALVDHLKIEFAVGL